jgi:uncharacterized protein YbjT (DUF2867 family)
MSKPLVLVVGASGRTGQRVVRALRRHGFPVRALVRDASKASLVASEGVEVLIGDVTDEADIRRALTGVTYLISALGSKGPTDAAHIELIEFTTIAELAQLAKDGRATLCAVLLDGGRDTGDDPTFGRDPAQKRRGELALEHSGVPFTIVRPGGLTDEPGGGGVAIARTLPGFGMIARDDVAEVMVQALLQPEAKNKIAEIINAPRRPAG